MTQNLDPSTAEGQMAMFRGAEARMFAVCRTFNEIMTGPNPLTPDEVDRLIAKRPEVYGVLSAFGTEPMGM